MTAENGYEELRSSILESVRTVIGDRRTINEMRCWFERRGQTLVVNLEGPEVSDRLRSAIAVRVLDAMWHSGRTHGEVDVSYHATTPQTART